MQARLTQFLNTNNILYKSQLGGSAVKHVQLLHPHKQPKHNRFQ